MAQRIAELEKRHEAAMKAEQDKISQLKEELKKVRKAMKFISKTSSYLLLIKGNTMRPR
jgi:hypothetical protein